MAKPTFAVVVHFGVKPGHEQEFFDAMIRQAETSVRDEPGCHQFDVCVDAEDRGKIFLYETYTDAEAFEVHKQTPHMAEFASTVAPWTASKEVSTWTITG